MPLFISLVWTSAFDFKNENEFKENTRGRKDQSGVKLKPSRRHIKIKRKTLADFSTQMVSFLVVYIIQ